MPLDVITLNALCFELNKSLCGNRISKVHQPEPDELAFIIKTPEGMKTLIISANASVPRLHLSGEKKENPVTAPPFCMLARKHLTGGLIAAVSLVNCDRIVKITVNSRNELNDNVNFFIFAELMGRYSNIILTKDDFTILDAIKRSALDNSKRFIFPGLKYEPVEQSKIRLDDTGALRALFSSADNITSGFILSNISGLAAETANEILFRHPLNPVEGINAFLNIAESSLYSPCVRYLEGVAKDFYVTLYSVIPGEYLPEASINSATERFFVSKDCDNRKKGHTAELTALIKKQRTKIEKKLAENEKKISDFENAEILKKYGELILSNIYKLNKRDDKLVCEDYYDGGTVEIPLDPLLHPQQNAQRYYKKYAKLKKGMSYAVEQTEALLIKKAYLESIAVSLENSSLQQEYSEIRAELSDFDGVKRREANNTPQKKKPSKYLQFNIGGFNVLLGKNNLQNNEVTFSAASPGDLWMHTKNYHGSHAIIKGNPVPENIIERAAELCAFYSGGKNLDKVEVDYTLKKYVKKITGAGLGMVTYTNHKTVLVHPQPPVPESRI